MVPWRATDDGFVTDDVIAWYRRFAEGRPGCSWSRRPASDSFRQGLSGRPRAVHPRWPGSVTRSATHREARPGCSSSRPPPDPAPPGQGPFFEQFLDPMPAIATARRDRRDAAEAPDAELRGRLIAMPDESRQEILSSAR
jgi:hypothetical protein